MLLFAIRRLDIQGIASQPFDPSLQPNANNFLRTTSSSETSMTPQQGKQTSRHHTQPSVATKMPAILFDLDGTLIDSNYQHVNTWSETLLAAGIVIPRWKIHRHVGMSGKSMMQELLRELGHKRDQVDLDQLEREHGRRFRRVISQLQPLPGVNQLLK